MGVAVDVWGVVVDVCIGCVCGCGCQYVDMGCVSVMMWVCGCGC